MPQAALLVVDDEPLNVSLLSQLLRPEFRVLDALSGPGALALLATGQPDLVLLDVMMPAMDGLTVLRRMRAQPALADIPVIFVTALGTGFDEEQGLALGAADDIVKPIKPAVRLADQNTWPAQALARRIRDGLLAQDLMRCAMAELAETRAGAPATTSSAPGSTWSGWRAGCSRHRPTPRCWTMRSGSAASRPHRCTTWARSAFRTTSCASAGGSRRTSSP